MHSAERPGQEGVVMACGHLVGSRPRTQARPRARRFRRLENIWKPAAAYKHAMGTALPPPYRRYRTCAALGTMAALAGLSAACGKAKPEGEAQAATASPGPAGKALVVGFIYVGPKGDYGYNQAHAEGA